MILHNIMESCKHSPRKMLLLLKLIWAEILGSGYPIFTTFASPYQAFCKKNYVFHENVKFLCFVEEKVAILKAKTTISFFEKSKYTPGRQF